ncbi:MAG: putative porin [Flavobacteriales bacterium]|jgi:hypothetical protein|tara:strand:- start:1247 stop:3217 length:1971 start_codon:yes stop_codon:yes gene_type:complete
MRTCWLYFITFFFYLCVSYSQDGHEIIPSKLKEVKSLSNVFNLSKDSITKSKLADIKKYLILNTIKDSVYLDTTLSIKKHYKFNYLRKDNFELLRFSNIGQTYNALTHQYDDQSFLPLFSFSSKQYVYLKPSDINYYHVPTPLTELMFKTVMEQGQFTDVFFSSNVSKKLNFSIAFKGLRSLGNYQNILSGSKVFIFTANYNSSNDRYNFRMHVVNQNYENKENGGLTDSSIINFESEDQLFKERSKLSVKFENAINNFSSKRYYFDHQFSFSKKKDSIKKNKLSIGHRFEYETLNNFFYQSSANEYYGNLSSGLNLVNDKTELRTTLNEFYTFLKSDFLGKIKVIYTNYNYNYISNSLSDVFKGFDENENAISFKINKNIFNHHLSGKITKNLFGERLGDLIDFSIASINNENFKYQFGGNITINHPGYYYELYKSSYDDLNWNNEIKKTQTKNVFLSFDSKLLGDLRLDFRLINNFTFFSLANVNGIVDAEIKTLIPKVNQLDSSIEYLKVKWQKEFKFGKFSLDNSLVFQKVKQNGDFLNLPVFLTRNTIYYSNTILNGAMFFQTGISVKYFSKYYSNEYNPLISSFHIQNEKKIGGFPLIDFFINAKIKHTRLFLKAEHFNSSLTGNNFYSSPSYPYRDFSIRFGLVWNFFN